MAQLNSLNSDLRWIKQVRSLLIEVARASLSDIPRLPKQVLTDALPLAQQAQAIQEKTAQSSDSSTWQSQQGQWIEAVRQLLLELSRIALSDAPKLPDNIAHRTLTLAETAADIQEVAESSSSSNDSNDADSLKPSAPLDPILRQVLEEMQAEQIHSLNPEASQWQKIQTLLSQVQDLYHQLHGSTEA
ncbi:MAG: hypothetical protein WBA77_18340 [Microcoleaceae cyanobacterium]